ncbi:MAG TPA: efflux RND transporter periplasmic adaptor subunit [bacterium]|nr:efflux RND transporter periplasmic adaptor subunit [bacterium]HPQ65510.1 efflux RND transporter periplasmic adaptor subunit [bacterium]
MKKIIGILLLAGAVGLFFMHSRPELRAATEPEAAAETETDILYYTCGMHPSVHITPEAYAAGQTQCPICSMDLIPVTKPRSEGRPMEGMVMVSPREKALAGIATAPVEMLDLFKEIRTAGKVAYDADLRSAQQEYLEARRAYDRALESQFPEAQTRALAVVEAARFKLKLAGVDEPWIAEIETAGKADDSLVLPGEAMWVYADFYEYESSWPRPGDTVEIIAPADPALVLTGEIKAVEPIVRNDTRTIRVKIQTRNSDGILKPNMYVDVYLWSEMGPALALPQDAVLDTGTRKLIYVEEGENGYVPREVVTGPAATAVVDGEKTAVYPLVRGAAEGERVVTEGNFLIDSQSRLGATASAYSGALDHAGHGK